MPIFSKLYRRFHMLTTDAIPDPPRIEIAGNTHNVNPNDANEKTNVESMFVPVASELQFEQNTDEKKSLPNDAAPTNTRSSKTEENFDDIKSSATDARPNVKTKIKPKQHRYSHVVNYNIVNSNGVQIGSTTNYICKFPTKSAASAEESWSKSKIRQMPVEVERLCACTKEITLNDIFIIKTHVGRGWKDVARRLLYSDGQIEQFEENYRSRGISEVIYQIFLDWKQANTKDAEIGNLINLLWVCREYDCVERLVFAHKDSA
ncbi:death domain-containing immune deficiency protein isoform X1 [Colletes latitarsis]|uniref:death domain-containing immune deficiency protein isoform X1 n=1 Tax=Colletes latitarsis TaxID=2605962 RepID=UPI004035B79B